MTYQLFNEDNLAVLRRMPDNSVHAVVTDPPYGLGKEPDALTMLRDWMDTGHHEVKGKGFMGKSWDAFVPQPAQWHEVYRVLKPGGHVLTFAGTRTQDLVALGLRLAGFEIRDLVAWVYGSGFPKSSNLKDDWQGWGTALKPALEPITLARKPLGGTVAQNVLKWHTGALNIDGCRVEHITVDGGSLATNPHLRTHINGGNGGSIIAHEEERRVVTPDPKGRWPANFIHDGSDEVVGLFPETKSGTISEHHQRHTVGGNGNTHGKMAGVTGPCREGDSGSASRFFYCAKTNASDRNEGCAELPDKNWQDENTCIPERENRPFNPSKNDHPTVKPTALMRYLCRLITPPGGTVLDPWMGSGSTGKACAAEGFSFIGIDSDTKHGYFKIAQARVSAAYPNDDFC
jgi:site-specific DNA-methyltransferase (adenine-specific)